MKRRSREFGIQHLTVDASPSRRHQEVSPGAYRGPAILIVVLVAAAFFPYLGTRLNIRYEHVVFYGSLTVICLLALAGRRLWVTPPVALLVSCWLVLGALCTLTTLGRRAAGLPALDPLAVADAFLLPMAVFIVTYTLSQRQASDAPQLLGLAAMTILIGLSLNTILIVFVDVADATDFLRNFWANPTSGFTTVAEKALRGGRYGGIFNQPFDAGVGYTVGVAAWMYLLRTKAASTRWGRVLRFTALALLIAGGVSAQSKTFVYGAALVVAVTLVLAGMGGLKHLTQMLRVVLTVVLAVAIAGSLGLVETYDRTFRMFESFGLDSRVSDVSGGRAESLDGYVTRFLEALSWVGRGLFGAQDDAFIAYIDGGGLVGILLFGATVWALFRVARAHPRLSPERVLGVSLTAFMTMACFGALAFQANRGSTLYWILMGLLAGYTAQSSNGTRRKVRPALAKASRALSSNAMAQGK